MRLADYFSLFVLSIYYVIGSIKMLLSIVFLLSCFGLKLVTFESCCPVSIFKLIFMFFVRENASRRLSGPPDKCAIHVFAFLLCLMIIHDYHMCSLL